MRDKLISIVIPAFNESDNIYKIATAIENVLEPLQYRYEIIMVADGCTDDTMEKIQELVKTNEHIFFIEFSSTTSSPLLCLALMLIKLAVEFISSIETTAL